MPAIVVTPRTWPSPESVCAAPSAKLALAEASSVAPAATWMLVVLAIVPVAASANVPLEMFVAPV